VPQPGSGKLKSTMLCDRFANRLTGKELVRNFSTRQGRQFLPGTTLPKKVHSETPHSRGLQGGRNPVNPRNGRTRRFSDQENVSSGTCEEIEDCGSLTCRRRKNLKRRQYGPRSRGAWAFFNIREIGNLIFSHVPVPRFPISPPDHHRCRKNQAA